MSRDSEWYGEPHILTVHSVTPPIGQFDDGEMDYEIEHPPSCTQEDYGQVGQFTVMAYTCDVGQMEGDCGLEFNLRYSGTPITEPGTYRIQSWGRKYYTWDTGYEYDGGIGVMDEGDSA